MNKKSLILILCITYVGSYILVSKDGYYMPIAFGAHAAGNRIVLASKNIGEKWIPFKQSKNTNWLSFVYSPLIFMDRLFWHQERPEDGSLKLREDYPDM
jgi:hypothetical protein